MKIVLIYFLMCMIFAVWFFIILDNELSKWKITTINHQYGMLVRVNKYDNVQYVLESNSCGNSHKVIIIVTCYVGHVELRSAHRRAITQQKLDRLSVKRVFLLANIPNHDRSITQKAIKDESDRFGDLVQGDFTEAYRNLTYKHIMGLNWAQSRCKSVDFIIKIDDDIVFNIDSILNYLNKFKQNDKVNFLLGYKMIGMKPIHNRANKWFVTAAEYSKSFYPPFLSGWLYVTTPQTAEKIFTQAATSPYFWIDDVFVTGILAAQLGIRLKDFKNDNIYLEYSELMDCCINDMILKNITCEYSVAPNGGDDNKFLKYISALDHCSTNHCISRPLEKPLQKTCIVSKSNLPSDKGKPVIKVLKL